MTSKSQSDIMLAAHLCTILEAITPAMAKIVQ